jgi:hypothetical protein
LTTFLTHFSQSKIGISQQEKDSKMKKMIVERDQSETHDNDEKDENDEEHDSDDN